MKNEGIEAKRHLGTAHGGGVTSAVATVMMCASILLSVSAQTLSPTTIAPPNTTVSPSSANATSNTTTSAPNVTSAPLNCTSYNVTLFNATTNITTNSTIVNCTSPETTAEPTTLAPTIAPSTKLSNTTIQVRTNNPPPSSTPVPTFPTQAPFPAISYYPAGKAAGLAGGFTLSPFNYFSKLTPPPTPPPTGTPVPDPTYMIGNISYTTLYFNQVDIFFASFSEARILAYAELFSKVASIPIAHLTPMYTDSTSGTPLSWQYGSQYIFSIMILNETLGTTSSNFTHAAAIRLEDGINTLATVRRSPVYQRTILSAQKVRPLPRLLVTFPVGINYLLIALIVFGILSCIATVLILIRGRKEAGSTFTPQDATGSMFENVPDDTHKEAQQLIQILLEKGQNRRTEALVKEAHDGKSLLGVSEIERSMVAGHMGKAHTSLFKTGRVMPGTMPVEVLLEHDRLFQLPPSADNKKAALKKLVSFHKSQSSISPLSRGGHSSGNEGPGRPMSMSNLSVSSKSSDSDNQVSPAVRASNRRRRSSFIDPRTPIIMNPSVSAPGGADASPGPVELRADLPSSIARFVDSDSDSQIDDNDL